MSYAALGKPHKSCMHLIHLALSSLSRPCCWGFTPLRAAASRDLHGGLLTRPLGAGGAGAGQSWSIGLLKGCVIFGDLKLKGTFL